MNNRLHPGNQADAPRHDPDFRYSHNTTPAFDRDFYGVPPVPAVRPTGYEVREKERKGRTVCLCLSFRASEPPHRQQSDRNTPLISPRACRFAQNWSGSDDLERRLNPCRTNDQSRTLTARAYWRCRRLNAIFRKHRWHSRSVGAVWQSSPLKRLKRANASGCHS